MRCSLLELHQPVQATVNQTSLAFPIPSLSLLSFLSIIFTSMASVISVFFFGCGYQVRNVRLCLAQIYFIVHILYIFSINPQSVFAGPKKLTDQISHRVQIIYCQVTTKIICSHKGSSRACHPSYRH